MKSLLSIFPAWCIPNKWQTKLDPADKIDEQNQNAGLPHNEKSTASSQVISSSSSSARSPEPEWSVDDNGNTYPEGGLQAWLVVLGALCSMFSGFGMVNSVGVLYAYMAEHQLKTYSDNAISWIFGIYIFLVFFCGLQIGPIFDARGPRGLVLLGSICMVSSCFLLSVCEGTFAPVFSLVDL